MMSPLRFVAVLLFLALPLLEIVALIEVGRAIGFWPTLGLLILSAAAGMLIIRDQGASMVGRMFDTMGQGGFAVASMVDSYVVCIAGFLLIIPGFISDAVGLALLVPPLRQFILGAIMPGFADARRTTGERPAQPGPQPSSQSEPRAPIIIEGTYRRIDEDDPRQ